MFFVFKQKTAYEMRISDWSSDVCSSDLTETQAEVNPDQVIGNKGLYFVFPTIGHIHYIHMYQPVYVSPLWLLVDNGINDLVFDLGWKVSAGQEHQVRGILGNSCILTQLGQDQIGSASCRERVCQSG